MRRLVVLLTCTWLACVSHLEAQVAPAAPVVAPASSGAVTVLGTGTISVDIIDQASLFDVEQMTFRVYRETAPAFVVTGTCKGLGPFTCEFPLSAFRLTTTAAHYAMTAANKNGESAPAPFPYTLKQGRPLCRADVTSDVSPTSARPTFATLTIARSGLQALLNQLAREGWTPIATAPDATGSWTVAAKCGGQ